MQICIVSSVKYNVSYWPKLVNIKADADMSVKGWKIQIVNVKWNYSVLRVDSKVDKVSARLTPRSFLPLFYVGKFNTTDLTLFPSVINAHITYCVCHSGADLGV